MAYLARVCVVRRNPQLLLDFDIRGMWRVKAPSEKIKTMKIIYRIIPHPFFNKEMP
jgi:hypothetical protein